MQLISSALSQTFPLPRSVPAQQFVPPGRPEQPVPPHVPQPLLQQTTLSLPGSTERMPCEHHSTSSTVIAFMVKVCSHLLVSRQHPPDWGPSIPHIGMYLLPPPPD